MGATSYILSSIFLGVFEVAVTGLLMALAVDMDANMGEPKRGPPTFHDRMKNV